MRVLLGLVALVMGLSGCASCEPLLDVRNCLDTQCVPSGDAVEVEWNADLAQTWPQITASMDRTELGEHDHFAWTPEQEQALWEAFNVTGDEPELIVHHDDERFRIRVLTCT